jgi:hypothetical protein
MTLKIKRTGADDYNRHIKALIFGEPGAGKTLMSSTFPNPLFVCAEPGLMSIADRDIPYIHVDTITDLIGVKSILDQSSDVRDELIGFPIETVVIDTIDEVQKILIAERLKSEKKDAMTLPDWGWLSEQMQALIRGFRNLDMHVVFTCHLKESTDSDSGRTYFKPGLQGAIADQIPGYVDLSLAIVPVIDTDVVDNQTVKVQRRYLHSFPLPSMSFLKDRSGKLPQVLEINFDDDFDRLNELVYGGLDLPESTEVIVEDAVTDNTLPSEEPQVEQPAEQAVAETPPVPVAEPAKKAVKKAVKKAAAKTEEKTPPASVGAYKYVTADGTEVMSRNELPDGVVPILRGFDTNYFCEETGNEVESEDQADLSKIRFRRVLCRDAHEALKR